MGQLDVLLLVPTPPPEAYLLNPASRQTYGPQALKILSAAYKLEAFVGRDLGFNESLYPPTAIAHRSLTAVSLATNLDRADLRWVVIDPGMRSLRYWRDELQRHQTQRPSSIAISTTYFMSSEWLDELIRACREISPQARIVVGGYMYGTASREFLSLNADLICVGEGEFRLPFVVKTIRDEQPFESIPGVYIRTANGDLKFTGPAEPLKLQTLTPPDWMLSKQIQPPIDPETDKISVCLETQRGCVFKCQFCTFRTLTSPSSLSVANSVDAILRTTRFKRGSYIMLTDPTATFPRQRWTDMMHQLAARGGAPHPIIAYARVNDLDADTVRVMVRANVRSLFIGQESGDPRILSKMRKGTNISQVQACITALTNSPITVTMGFIHGFPGETPATMRATREMICSLNRGTRCNPVVTEVALSPFMPQDLASVSYDERLIEKMVPTELAIEELLATFIASSQVRHAPLMFGIGPTSFIEPFALLRRMSKQELFGWYKAVQRGVAIFLEKDLDGKNPNPNELRQLRDFIAEPMCERTQLENSYVHKMSRPLKSRTYRLLSSEFQKEPRNRPGLLTRFALAKVSYAAHRSILRGWTSFWRVQAKIECSAQVGELAGSIVSSAIDAPRRRLAVLRAEKKATAK